MTPEDLNRTIEFIVQSQARLAAAQEQDREDRIRSEEDRIRSEKESKAFDRRLASLFEMQTHLLANQSKRLDECENENKQARQRHEEFQKEFREENKAAHRRHEESREEFRQMMSEIRTTLNRILDKLPDRLN